MNDYRFYGIMGTLKFKAVGHNEMSMLIETEHDSKLMFRVYIDELIDILTTALTSRPTEYISLTTDIDFVFEVRFRPESCAFILSAHNAMNSRYRQSTLVYTVFTQVQLETILSTLRCSIAHQEAT